jgi:uncharacterized membrane protein YidH (DUF202 family)
MSTQLTEHIDGLLRPLGNGTPSTVRPGRQAGTQAPDDSSRPPRTAPEELNPTAITPASPSDQDDIAQLRDTFEQQNELMRAILASLVDTQEDARSTAQNSRTFAWAGTAIALLTLIATVISIVAAVALAHSASKVTSSECLRDDTATAATTNPSTSVQTLTATLAYPSFTEDRG